eukprot:493760-Alexandrium_andersonii.AAC.1
MAQNALVGSSRTNVQVVSWATQFRLLVPEATLLFREAEPDPPFKVSAACKVATTTTTAQQRSKPQGTLLAA